MNIILNILPILGHLIFLPFWIFHKNCTGMEPELEIIFSVLIVPIYLVIVNYIWVKKSKIRMIIPYIIMIIVVVVGEGIRYLNWGLSSGNIFHPDPMTIGLTILFFKISLLIITVVWGMICAVRISKRY